jgi:hypothetical protein
MERPATPVGPVHHRRHGKARFIGSRHWVHMGKTWRSYREDSFDCRCLPGAGAGSRLSPSIELGQNPE